MHYPEIAGREWQQEGLAKAFHEFFPNEDKDTFLTVACPGAGKTRFAIAMARMAFDLIMGQRSPLLVVVAPTETVRDQWQTEAKKYGIALHHYSSNDLRDAMVDGVDDEIHGIVTTYAQVAMVEEVFESFCSVHSVFLITDEIHHCAEHLTWGDKLQIAFNRADKKLVLSGTPFRTDEGLMPFIMAQHEETEWRVMSPDANYPYGQACDDHVCRVVTFPRVNAKIRFEDDDGVWEHLLDDVNLEPQFRNRMYRAALDPVRSDFCRYLLAQAWEKLQALRKTDQPDAAMLIVAKDNAHADKLKDIVHAITGLKPVVVNSDRPNSSDKIKRFKNSKKPIIIAVKMFSEGVDAPRIRVLAFLTQVKTAMWFRQIVGRIVRMQEQVPGDQPAFMFIPKIPAFEDMAREIEEEIDYVVEERKRKATWLCESCGHENPITAKHCEECGAEKPVTPPPPPPPTITVHGSTDEEMQGFIAMGLDIEQGVTEATAQLIESDDLLKRFQPEHVALIFKAMAGNPVWAKRFRDVVVSKEENRDDDDY